MRIPTLLAFRGPRGPSPLHLRFVSSIPFSSCLGRTQDPEHLRALLLPLASPLPSPPSPGKMQSLHQETSCLSHRVHSMLNPQALH